MGITRWIILAALAGAVFGWITAPWVWTAQRWEDGSARYGWTDTVSGSFVGVTVKPGDR